MNGDTKRVAVEYITRVLDDPKVGLKVIYAENVSGRVGKMNKNLQILSYIEDEDNKKRLINKIISYIEKEMRYYGMPRDRDGLAYIFKVYKVVPWAQTAYDELQKEEEKTIQMSTR